MSRRDWTYWTQRDIDATPLPAPLSDVERLRLQYAEAQAEIAALYVDIEALCMELDYERERNWTLVKR